MKISFFTTCGNRLQHLKRTLPENIETNLKYKLCEHIILDYGSTDGMIEWVIETFPEYIKSGRLKLFRYDADFFWHNHAKNMAAKCTSKNADIICSIDADNYTALGPKGESLAWYLNRIFIDEERNIFVRAAGWDHQEENYMNDMYITDKNKYHSASGKLAFRREDFFKLRGFNEDLKGHYYDEEELWRRAVICWGWERKTLPVEFSKFINHSNFLRLNNLDPKLVDKEKLLGESMIDLSVKDYMEDDLALPVYPQAKKNKKIFEKVMEKKVKLPNGKKWGVGNPKRIKLK